MTKRRYFHNGKPINLSVGAPRDTVRAEFARRLQRKMAEHGINQSELARRAAKFIPDGKFGRDNVSNYVRGISLPRPIHLATIAKVFDCSPDDLLPCHGVARADDIAPPFDMRDAGDGHAWIRVNQALPWPVALEIARLLSGVAKPKAA